MTLVIFCLWLPGAALAAGLLWGWFPPRRDSEGYQVMLAALSWPVWVLLGAYYRLANWVLFDLADLDREACG